MSKLNTKRIIFILDNDRLYYIISLFTAILLFCILFLSTKNGLATSPDSIAYIKGAFGFVSGHGYSYVSAEWPPLYPTLLIGFSYFTNDDVLLAARILQSLLFSLNFILLSQILLDYFNKFKILSILFAVLISTHSVMLLIHFYAWSEPTLLFLILCDILLINKFYFYQYKNKFILEAILILFASLALLTRFAGITLAALNFIIIFTYFNKISFINKLIRAILQLIVPISIFIPWTFHRAVQNGPATQRSIEYHSISIDSILYGLDTVGKWLTFENSPNYFKVINALIGIFALIFLIIYLFNNYILLLKNMRNMHNYNIDSKNHILLILNSYIFIYIIFIISAISFVDSKVILDDRILSPIFISLFLIFFYLYSNIKNKFIKFLTTLFIIFLMYSSYANIRTWILLSYFNGIELSDIKFKNKSINKFLLNCSEYNSIYADNPWNFDLLFKTKVLWLPRETLFNTGHINYNYQSEIESLSKNAELIIIENRDNKLINALNSMPSLKQIYHYDDGIIWANISIASNLCGSIN